MNMGPPLPETAMVRRAALMFKRRRRLRGNRAAKPTFLMGFPRQKDASMSNATDDVKAEPPPEPARREAREQPEALANFAAAARSDGKVSPTGGLQSTVETAPIPTDPDLKADAATKILREGAFGTDQGADEAVDRLPDRTRAR
jgi:hypothetical protein